MGGFNKILSFVLGLVVVIVFLAVLGSRANITKNFLIFNRDKISITPTPTVRTVSILTVTPTPVVKQGFFDRLFGRTATPTPTKTAQPTPTTGIAGTQTAQQTAQSNGVSRVTSIPSAGSPTAILPILASALGMGIYLRKKI